MADELRELNEPREADTRFDEKLCEALIARCNAGEFSEAENADGEWAGANAIRMEVRALCMQAQHEMDITHASTVAPPRRGSCQHGMLTEGAQKDNYENICSASSRDPSPLRGASLAQGSPYKPAGEPLSWSLPVEPETNHETVADRLINNRGEF